MKQKLSNFLKEILPVIIGILVALFINNWNEDRKDKIYISKITNSLKKELNSASDEISNLQPKQILLIDSLEFYKNENISIFEIIRKVNGAQFPSFNFNSWNALKSSRIELIDYNFLSQMTAVENANNSIHEKTESIMQYIYPNLYSIEKEKKEVLQIMIADVIPDEKELKVQIDSILSK